MMKKLVLCSLLALGLIQCDCFGIKKSNSTDGFTRKKLIVYGNTSQETQRRYSDPVTPKEKSDVSHHVSVNDFLLMSKSEATQFDNVKFIKVNIDGKFVDKFWELFSSGKEELNFEDCCADNNNYSFSDLFDGDYPVRKLMIKSNDLTIDDVDSIFSLVYPYLIRQFVFCSTKLQINEVKANLIKRLGSCAPELKVTDTMSE